jgi:hypothetical protein
MSELKIHLVAWVSSIASTSGKRSLVRIPKKFYVKECNPVVYAMLQP